MVEGKPGFAPFRVGEETYQTWYIVFGELGAGRRPIVVLHGGGGMSHHYMLPHTVLGSRLGVPIVLYDQIGNGQSTHLPDAPKEFWKPELWMDELDNLLKHLGIAEDFDLLGNSWGGMLAGQFVATRTPPGLKNLIVGNSPASMPLLQKGTKALLAKYPDVAATMEKHAKEGSFTSQEYRDATQKINIKHFCTIDPMPQDALASVMAVIEDPTVYSNMVGPSIYHVTGNIKSWSIVDILHNIRCPTLLFSSPNDVVQPIAILPWFQKVQKIKWVELQNSTHLPMFEEPGRYFDAIVAFLNRDESHPEA